LQWCPLCGHGGHYSCSIQWFEQSTCCPTGCGHKCCFSLLKVEKREGESNTKRSNSRRKLGI
jgi:hypothetical protein